MIFSTHITVIGSVRETSLTVRTMKRVALSFETAEKNTKYFVHTHFIRRVNSPKNRLNPVSVLVLQSVLVCPAH